MSIIGTVNKLAPCTAFWGVYTLSTPGGLLSPIGAGLWNDRTIQMRSRLDVRQLTTTEAQNPLDVRGGDLPHDFSLTIEPNKVAGGLSPLTVFKAWQQALGKSNLFFMGVLPISSSMYILQDVRLRLSNSDFESTGEPWHARIELHFVEDRQTRGIGKVAKAQAQEITSGTEVGMKPGARLALT